MSVKTPERIGVGYLRPVTEPTGASAWRGRRTTLFAAVAGVGLVLLLVWASYAIRGRAHVETGTSAAASQTSDPAAEEMTAGLAATDPAVAAGHFRRALRYNPTHYGASFQLARALDLAGRREDAQAAWQRVLQMAEEHGDAPLIEAARARLGNPASDPAAATAQADAMKLGLDALHTKGDAVAAAALFREVLAANPEHYGATFQLATASTAQTSAPRPARSGRRC
jgi:tetratricopeptide (TPR) repeat protein